MNRDVERRQPVLENAGDVLFLDVRERGEIAVGKRETVIVVADVEIFTESGRKAFDETELAAVGAAANVRRLEGEAERLTIQPLQFVDDRFAVGLLRLDYELFFSGKKFPIEKIGDRAVVHREELRPGDNPDRFGDPSLLYSRYPDHGSSKLRTKESEIKESFGVSEMKTNRGAIPQIVAANRLLRSDRRVLGERLQKLSRPFSVEAGKLGDCLFAGIANALDATELLEELAPLHGADSRHLEELRRHRAH